MADSNAISDGDEKGKGEDSSGSIGSKTDINERTSSYARNIYKPNLGYDSNHPNALSTGDEKGKGENSGNIGGLTDINERNVLVGRNKYGYIGRVGGQYPDF